MAVKKIKDIYSGYFQKSKVFLYPVLGLKRGSISPINTYFSWEENVTIEDIKLVCLHYLRDDDEFLNFEDKGLLGNSLYEDYKEVDHDKAVYIFNLSEHEKDFNHVIAGRYSKISNSLKNKIKNYYGPSTANYAFIDSYLYPENYYDTYAKFLTTNNVDFPGMVNLLKEVGELCSKPNFKKEELKMSVNALNLK